MTLLDLFQSAARAGRWGRFQRSAVWISQLCAFAVSGIAAFLLRFEFTIPEVHRKHLWWALLLWIPAKSIVFWLLKLDRGWWRFVSVHDLARLALGNIAGSALAGILIYLAGPPGFPRSLYVLDLVLCFLATAGIRVSVKLLVESLGQAAEGAIGKRVLIYGAGGAGVTLLREIRSNAKLQYAVCGFVDDSPHKKGLSIQGLNVLGSGAELSAVAVRNSVSEVLIALPSATGAEMITILNRCQIAGLKCRTIPALTEIIEGDVLATQIRPVAVEDLLGRTPARLDQDQIYAKLGRNTILVTGAAGSIGSELCRQIARFNPRAIVAFEIAETPLFNLEREMRQAFAGVPFYAEIGSVQNKQRIAEVLDQYRPSILYHAAAYKHVPLMEAQVFEAIENNVFGTWNVALAAANHGVEDFVMISSDKAVRPTNIMGATKRVAELLILGLRNHDSKFASVRFGNVLGSNGSVIPIFKQQIAAGGPVTVTHPEMQRYFMTIPEASQLVLQASTMGHGGEIFVLDMGQPVRIVDLARNLILLSGLRPDEDIKIEFTGVRPGEKLYEELNLFGEDILATHHEKIKIFSGNGLPFAGMEPYLAALRDICDRRDVPGLVLTLKDLIPDYNPSSDILSRALSACAGPRQVATMVV